jgi:hypothetical protein
MLPRLAAEEAMLAATEVGIGMGAIERDEARRIARTWERAANPTYERPKAQKLTPDQLQALGIGYVVVEKSNNAG